ncbi:tyrosine-type recombinase/integrase [Rhodospirillum centenum]|uniref:Phage integrase n=1 Tax=Rhodospirillum centenum (strain ATCC 51521 / SW) TaxID=414684 RepID=B6IMM4_RHOCS|nr:site-specific integrase [Rhodospirillum centenum]ACI98690.1 phage integrase [Rhodospirillum centenum SW]
MARTVADTNLSTKAKRAKLAPRPKPYWREIDRGRHVGYYRGSASGSWIARRFLGGGKYQERRLGMADDIRDADGIEVLSFEQAQAAARIWFEDCARADLEAERRREAEAAGEPVHQGGPWTVRDAVASYLATLQNARTRKEFDTEAKAHILPALGGIDLSKLTSGRITKWLEGIANSPPRLRTKTKAAERRTADVDMSDPDVIRRRRHTANHQLKILKAALNHAYRGKRVETDSAWATVRPFKGVSEARVRWLAQDEAVRLVNASAPDLRAMVRGALLTGCRYEELARLRVQEIDLLNGSVYVRLSKSGKPRHVVLTEEGVAFFRDHTAGRTADDLVFTRANGEPWGKSHQHRPIKDACAAAKIKPAISFHILRHTHASWLAQRGVSMQVIAAQLGHSDTRITERHYAHLSPSHHAAAVRAALPNLGLAPASNVAALRTGRG